MIELMKTINNQSDLGKYETYLLSLCCQFFKKKIFKK